jgi:membrane-bound lytic murein transglycosylase B
MVNADAQDLRPGRVATPGFLEGDVAAPADAAPPAAQSAPPKGRGPHQTPAPHHGDTQAAARKQVTAQQHLDDSRFDVRPWAASMAPKVGIPATALAAYGSAELRLAQENPGCHLSWVALAGIGSVESDHGRFGGAVIRADGTSWPPIIGVALDGEGVGHVPDSDRGVLDGDRTYDRAVGPMQFLPGTWRVWGADADGDRVANPFALPDAALAAARYLCAVGGDLRQTGPWRAALWSYNRSDAYAVDVSARSNGYAVASRR